MFDNKPNNQNKQVPPNLPTFKAAPAPQPLKEPEDILDTIDKVSDNIQGPSTAMGQPSATVPPALTPPAKAVSKEPFMQQYKKIVTIVLGVVLLGGVATAGWYGYNVFVAPRLSGDAMVDDQKTNTNQPAGNTNQAEDGELVVPKPIDTDRDGLDDDEEKLYGTNLDRVDTDLDGLTDRDEVKVFKTDPNNPDSDGDTFLDGNEVRAGYDPKGDGRLLEINNQ